MCKKGDSQIITKVGNGVACEICKAIISQIDKLVGANASVSQIVAAVEKVCSILPSSLKGTCDSFIEEYGPMVIAFLINKYPASQICATIGLCKEVNILPVPPVKKVSNPVMCAVCKLVLAEIEKYISQNATEKQIIDALDKVCASLPKSYAPICTAFVDQYAHQIIQALINKYPPNQVCAQIGVCPNKTMIITKVLKPKSSNAYCQVCEYILTEIDKYLAENATEKEIVFLIEHICNLLPLKVRDICDAFIEEHGVAIINLLLNKIQPEHICKSLKLCTDKKMMTLVRLFEKNSKIPMI